MNSSKIILLSYGVGGHSAQMNRLAPKLIPCINDSQLISISDNKVFPCWSSDHFVTGEVRGKESHYQILFNLGPLKVLRSLLSIGQKYKVEAVISTGPGISVISALFFKVRGAKVIHIETWSRFTTKSLTGRFMYFIADKFYIQNESLIKVYPKAIYSGLL